MKSINPCNNETIKEYTEFSDTQVDYVLAKSKVMFKSWSKTSIPDRSKFFYKLSDVLIENKEKYSLLITEEVGKPISQSYLEIEKCALVCKYYADNASDFLKDNIISTDYKVSKVVYKPLGSILAIMPWNYPFWQVIRFAVPTLIVGNTAILKHASNVSGCALAIEEAFMLAGFDDHIFKTLLVSSSKVERIIKNPIVKAVSFTGSTDAGKKVAKVCGENLKKCLLELGGSDPYIIMKDANLENAARLCSESRMQNNGQSCIGAKRFIVHEDVYDKFLHLFTSKLKSYTDNSSNPLDLDCNLGPMARIDLKDELITQINKSKDMGATVTYLSKDVPSSRAYLPPVIIENITKEMSAYNEEFFGPVASIFKFKNIEDAIKIANDTPFGLGSGIFSSDTKHALNIAENHLDSGASFVNSYVKSNPKLPFGGIKESGFGRELSKEGILEFVNIKVICLE